MANINFKLDGVQDAINKLQKTGGQMAKEVDEALAAGTDSMALKAKQLAPKDVGFLASSISAKKVKTLNYQLVAQKDYAAFVEFGTKSNFDSSITDEAKAAASHFKGKKSNRSYEEFERAIIKWVKRKQIRFDSAGTYKSGKKKGKNKQLTYEQTAYFIMQHIMLRGIKPHPFFFPAYYEYKKKIISTITDIINEKRQ